MELTCVPDMTELTLLDYRKPFYGKSEERD